MTRYPVHDGLFEYKRAKVKLDGQGLKLPASKACPRTSWYLSDTIMPHISFEVIIANTYKYFYAVSVLSPARCELCLGIQ